MNVKVHPKKIKSLVELLYTEYPIIRSHPDYRIYYFFTDYPEESEYVFVVTIQYLIYSDFAQNLNQSLNLYKDMFGLKECSLISEHDFEIILKKEIEDLYDKIRGSSFNALIYEIW